MDIHEKFVPKILIIGGAFSGITASLTAAFRAKGIEVTVERTSLRNLRLRWLHIFVMYTDAFWSYGMRFRRYLHRTSSAYRSFSIANEKLVSRYGEKNVVLILGANASSFWRNRCSTKRYILYTDHTNLLTKKAPEYGASSPERLVKPIWNEIERRIVQQQEYIFTMGSHVKHSMVKDYGICDNRIHAVGGGPNLDLDVQRDGITKEHEKKNVLFVGLDVKRKGLKILVKAFEKVLEEHSDAVLHVVGTEGNSNDSVKYYGVLRGKSLANLFYASQVFAMPTLREPFGIVFIEAMYAKAVCIGTNIGAIPEIIENENTGYVIEPNDHTELAKRISKLLSDPVLLQGMADRAYRKANDQFRWDLVAERILATLDYH